MMVEVLCSDARKDLLSRLGRVESRNAKAAETLVVLGRGTWLLCPDSFAAVAEKFPASESEANREGNEQRASRSDNGMPAMV